MLYSSSCAYAVRALARLASIPEEPLVKLQDLARQERIPYPFLAKICNDLVSAGLLRSSRGPRGGYALTRAPGAISLYDIRAAVDGIADLEACVLGLEQCPGDRPCAGRRRFLALAATAGFGVLASPADLFAAFQQIAPVSVANPLEHYPNRDWERIYRNLFHTDGSYVFLCAPNDTHNCLLRAHVKNDVVVRIEPTYGYAKATDLSATRPPRGGIHAAARRGWC
jgi:Rrf2 family protein